MTTDIEGAWCVCDRDYYETITSVYPTEVEALRTLNGRGFGRVRFVPYGKSLNELDDEEGQG